MALSFRILNYENLTILHLILDTDASRLRVSLKHLYRYPEIITYFHRIDLLHIYAFHNISPRATWPQLRPLVGNIYLPAGGRQSAVPSVRTLCSMKYRARGLFANIGVTKTSSSNGF